MYETVKSWFSKIDWLFAFIFVFMPIFYTTCGIYDWFHGNRLGAVAMWFPAIMLPVIYLWKTTQRNRRMKQIDKEIPRDQQGWWADVAAGKKLLLRPAVQADIDRCHLGPRRSKNPDDYMCETQTNGSLVSKIVLEYMNPEENVFAAIPAPPTSAEGVEHG